MIRGSEQNSRHLKSSAELSVQGDDFTRQIWHMYATFEEFVDHQTGGEKPKVQADATSTSTSAVDNATRFEQKTSPTPALRSSRPTRAPIGGSYMELTSNMAGSGPQSMSPQIPPLEFLSSGSKDDMSLEYRRPHYRSRYRRGRKRLGVSNPLLDTINSISWMNSDDPDSIGTEGTYADHGSFREPKYFGNPKYTSDFDRDSISYAGSNSIDSGYKSYCPTPEPSDGLFYNNETSSKRGSISSQCSQKPRIPMGTRVLNRNSMSQYYSTDDEQDFRHSLLSVMQPGPGPGLGPGSGPTEASSALGLGLGLRPRSLSTSSAGGYRRPVSPLSQRSLRASCPSCPSSRTHSPCYSVTSGKSSPVYHRSKLPSDEVGYLFSKRVQDEASGNFINVIDDKNRWSGIARVKKLRDKCRSNECSSSSESSCPSPSSNLPPGSERFSDVARCILEIVEDLQKSGSCTNFSGGSSPPAPAPASRGGESRAPSSTGLPPLDYHVYEEIMYDLMTTQKAKAQQAPPPLPARPEALLTRKPPTAAGLGSCGAGAGLAPASGLPSTTTPPLLLRRPNQRSNIYSIFRDQGVRRGISESLEIEAQRPPTRRPAPHPPDFLTDDEYGFVASRSDLNFQV